MYIYIALEVKARELEGRALLASVAAERGHKVILGGKEDTRSLARKGFLPPGIVHDKSLGGSPYKKKILSDLLKNGHIVTSQDEESGLLDESYARIINKYHSDCVEMTTFGFCWGDHDHSAIIERYPEYASKFIKSGSPRVDLWRREFNPYYEKSGDYKIDVGNYILIATNFSTVLNQNLFWNFISERRDKIGFAEEHEYELYEMAAWQLKMMTAYIRAVRRLARECPDVNFILRPHPVENINAWHKILGDIKNVQVIRSGGVNAWIRGAQALIQNSCTTALEASVSGIPVISFRPVKSNFEHRIPNSVGIEVDTDEELVNVVNKIANKRGETDQVRHAQSQNINDIIHRRFCNVEGRFAADVIVDHWERVGEKLHDNNNRFNGIQRFMFRNLLKSPISRIVLSSRDFIKRGAYSTKRYKLPDISHSEVEQMISGFGSALGRFSNIRVSQFGRRSVLIEKGSGSGF